MERAECGILNSPYHRPTKHWDLDQNGIPTSRTIRGRRPASFITPIPRPRKQKAVQQTLDVFDTYSKNGELSLFINSIRDKVDQWRNLPDNNDWKVTPTTRDLLTYWRHHQFDHLRPFFCQIEAVETAIWLAEVAPKGDKKNKTFLESLKMTNLEANPEIFRIALKLATGAGKTTVMAMLIAWQTLNAIRSPKSNQFTTGFLIITPGITIRDRLRVLQPNDPESYYKYRELVPSNLLQDMGRAKIVITNYHAFKLRKKIEISAVTEGFRKGKTGEELNTLETEADMIDRVMSPLKGIKNLLVINDEAHHCYRERPESNDIQDLKGEEKEEAKENNETARLWISGIEAVKRQLGVQVVYDLSATPFFLRGSGYEEGTLFPWTVSDFSLMDAIECGIVGSDSIVVVV